MNTFFKKNPNRKWTWISPDGRTRNEIDFILANRNYIIQDVNVLNKFHTGSDHRLVRTKLVVNQKFERRKMMTQNYLSLDMPN